jgi:hypothetical protein
VAWMGLNFLWLLWFPAQRLLAKIHAHHCNLQKGLGATFMHTTLSKEKYFSPVAERITVYWSFFHPYL